MHQSSYELMRSLLYEYQDVIHGAVLDCGSMIADSGMQVSYRDHVEKLGMEYVGLDMAPGPNVDVVANLEQDWFLGEPFDLVISGQMLEHVTMPILAAQQMKRAVKVGGHIILIAPWQYGLHRHPIDCWRIFPDAMEFLLEGFEDVKTGMRHNDCWGVGRRPEGYKTPWNISRS